MALHGGARQLKNSQSLHTVSVRILTKVRLSRRSYVAASADVQQRAILTAIALCNYNKTQYTKVCTSKNLLWCAGSEDQIYVLSVTGHVFAAHLISHLSLENLDGAVVRQLLALKLCCRTLQLQHRLIFRAVRRPPCSCSHCGRTQLFHQGMETPEIKVCSSCCSA